LQVAFKYSDISEWLCFSFQAHKMEEKLPFFLNPINW